MSAPFFRSSSVLALVALAAAMAFAAPQARADATFANPGAITINDSLGGAPMQATPYPSRIDVAGVTGTPTAVTVTLHGFHHSCPQDVDVLLVAPSGADTLLMSDAGDCTGDTSRAPIDLTFDQSAPPIPCGTTDLAGGTYSPADYADHDCVNPGDFPDTFPSPAPAGPWPVSLDGFAGQDPNGAWSLYVVDDQNGDSGAIDGGWSLQLAVPPQTSVTPATPPPTPQPQPQPSPPPDLVPAAKFSARHVQSVLRSGRLSLAVRCTKPGVLTATGTVSVPGKAATYRLARLTRNVATGDVKLSLKLPRRALAAIRGALRAHRPATARISIAFTDASGDSSSRRLAIRLR